MHSREGSHPELAANPNVDEFLRQEGMTEEEWKRIYDLRYCTILVPFEEDPDKKGSQEDRADNSISKEPQTVTPVLTPISTPVSTPVTRERRQLATPTTPQGRRPFLSRQGASPKSPSSPPIGLLTPTEKRSLMSSNPRRANQRNGKISSDHGYDTEDEPKSFLTDRDPLSSYLTASSRSESHRSTKAILTGSTRLTTAKVDDEDTDTAEMETFHDALDFEAETHTRHAHKQGEKSEPSGVGKKRRHWEIEILPRLLQPRQPEPQKRVAITTTTSNTPVPALSKPVSFEPNPTSIVLSRRGSTASDISLVSHEGFSRSSLWTSQDWKLLEKIYDDMDGDSMTESDLDPVAECFLKEHESKTGEASPWSRKKVLTRCVALQRVRQNRHWTPSKNGHDGHEFSRESTPQPAGHRGFDRQLLQPYHLRSSSAGSAQGSPGSISDFLSQRRADRSHRQREADHNYQLKSVFKHRLASGLRTVGQLLPFWKDVERGNADIKEKVVVPLVPSGKAQAVIEVFETQSLDALSESSRSESICSSRGRERARGSVSSVPSTETVAEMLARGHASRSASASSRASSA
ncbi:MAG: hypothetical protein J3Q66DRAFT_328609 [Benniella sp.]|nr:MAG: hypothetical protein J3Q66DRAFT_328609 [Benniella sp.]